MGTSDMSPVRIALVLSCLAVPAAIADEHEAPGQLSAIDFNFVGQANLGAPFQINSGRIAEVNGSQPAIREYAHLMVTSHIPVVEALNGILQRKNVTPSNALLQGAYNAMLSTLN